MLIHTLDLLVVTQDKSDTWNSNVGGKYKV